MNLFEKLKKGLLKTNQSLNAIMTNLFAGRQKVDEDFLVELEEALIAADMGVKASSRLIASLREKAKRGELAGQQDLRGRLKELLLEILSPAEAPLDLFRADLFVIMVLGVNGSGKTTTIGKMAHLFKSEGKKVVIAAADTFRAAAIEQMEIWGRRAGCEVIKHKAGADPSAVVFDAIQAAQARGAQVVIADTAGRLHTQINLMEELKKIKRVMGKQIEGSPHEVLLVLDATNGQNSLAQAKQFHAALGVTGMALAKLDGTARAGVVVPIVEELKLPVRFLGVGEDIDDLQPFRAKEFLQALVGD